MVGAHNEGLRLIVGNTSDAEIAVHLLDIIRKLGAERAVLNVVDGTVEAVLSVNSHAAAAGAEVGVIIRAEEEIKDTIFLECRCKDTAHRTFLSKCAYMIPKTS